MKSITVYDPPLCCSTGVCGPDVDPVLPWFAGILKRLADNGVNVARHNLAQQPLAFVTNAKVKALLDEKGTDALPAIFIDGELTLHGAYPDRETGESWVVAAAATP